MEAQICEMTELSTLMPPAASSISVLGLRIMCRRRPAESLALGFKLRKQIHEVNFTDLKAKY